jgi:hypothetical protein
MINAEVAQRDGYVVGIPLLSNDLHTLARAADILRQRQKSASDADLLAQMLLAGAALSGAASAKCMTTPIGTACAKAPISSVRNLSVAAEKVALSKGTRARIPA